MDSFRVRGEGHPNAKLTEEDIRQIRKCHLQPKDVARHHHISEGYARKIMNYEVWQHISPEECRKDFLLEATVWFNDERAINPLKWDTIVNIYPQGGMLIIEFEDMSTIMYATQTLSAVTIRRMEEGKEDK